MKLRILLLLAGIILIIAFSCTIYRVFREYNISKQMEGVYIIKQLNRSELEKYISLAKRFESDPDNLKYGGSLQYSHGIDDDTLDMLLSEKSLYLYDIDIVLSNNSNYDIMSIWLYTNSNYAKVIGLFLKGDHPWLPNGFHGRSEEKMHLLVSNNLNMAENEPLKDALFDIFCEGKTEDGINVKFKLIPVMSENDFQNPM